MTNENQKKSPLKKYKFLVPQIVNLGFIGFVCFLMGRFDMFVTIAFVMTTILATVYSRLIYKFDNDSDYRKEAISRIEENKKLPRKYRYNVSAQLGGLVFLLYIGAALTIYSIIRNLLDHEFAKATILIVFALLVFVLIKILNKFFSEK